MMMLGMKFYSVLNFHYFFFNLILICLVENLCFSPTTKTLFLYLIIILSAAAFYT